MMLKTVVCGAYQTNAYLIRSNDRDGIILIDPGDDLSALEQAIRETGGKLTDILLTHGHFDHMLSCAALCEKYGATVHVHASDEPMLRQKELSLYDESASIQPYAAVESVETYPDGENFDLYLNGIHFRGTHTPGHTPGGVALCVEEEKWLFTGDTLFAHGYGRYDFEGGDLHQLLRSLKTLLAMDGALTVLPGHGESDALSAVQSRWHRK